MANTAIKRLFRITGLATYNTPPAKPEDKPPPGVMVSAVPIDSNIEAPPNGFQWPFTDPDGGIAATLKVNGVMEISFQMVDDPAAP